MSRNVSLYVVPLVLIAALLAATQALSLSPLLQSVFEYAIVASLIAVFLPLAVNIYHAATHPDDQNNDNGQPGNMHSISTEVLTYAVLVLLIGALLAVLYYLNMQAEIQIGLVIVLSLVILIVLVYVVANGFYHLSLTSAGEALGLPPGSVRALLALFMVVLFTIMGIYLFRSVGGAATFPVMGLTVAEVIALGERLVSAREVPGQSGALYNVWVRGAPMTDDGVRLAQQLLTTVGTLVVAVAGFYFGSASVNAATKALRGESALSILTESPLEVEVNQAFKDRIEASGGVLPYTWTLIIPPEQSERLGNLKLAQDGSIMGPGLADAGSYPFTVMVKDRAGSAHSKDFVLKVS